MEYTGKKQYKLDHCYYNYLNCVFEVDFDHPLIWEKMRQRLDFFGEDYEEDSQEDTLHQHLKLLAQQVWYHGANGQYNTQGVRREVEEQEGFGGSVDGDHGFTLLEHQVPEPDDDFEIEETEGVKYFEAQ